MIWKEVVVAKFYPRIFVERIRKTAKTSQGSVPAEIRTEDLSNTTSKRYRLSQLTRQRIVEKVCQVDPADIRTKRLV
jgi:hypothetical protein